MSIYYMYVYEMAPHKKHRKRRERRRKPLECVDYYDPEDVIKILNNHIICLDICNEIATYCFDSYLCMSCGSFNESSDGITCDICGCGLCESCSDCIDKLMKDYTKTVCNNIDCYFCSRGSCWNHTCGRMCNSCYAAVGCELDLDYSNYSNLDE